MNWLAKISIPPSLKLLLSMLIFGTIGLFVKATSLPSGFIAAARGIIGGVIILVFILLIKKKPDKASIKNNLIPLLLSGAFIGINWVLLFESYRYASVAVATLCYYMAPVFVVIFTPLVLRVRVSVAGWICVSLALLGMVLVSSVGLNEGGNLTGVLLALGAAAFYAAVTFINKKMKEISQYDTTVVQLLSAALVVLIYSLACEHVTAEMLDFKSVAVVLLLGVVHTGVAYVLFFGSVKALASETVAVLSYIDPIVAVLLSALVLGEPTSPRSIIGAVIIIASTLALELVTAKKKPIKNTEI